MLKKFNINLVIIINFIYLIYFILMFGALEDPSSHPYGEIILPIVF